MQLRVAVVLAAATLTSIASAELPHHPEVHTFAPSAADIPPPDRSGGTYALAGSAVAMRDDIAAVTMGGKAHVALFQRKASGWVRTGTLSAPEVTTGFGAALALRDHTLVVAAQRALYVYKLVDGRWTYRQKLAPSTSDNVSSFTGSLRYQDNLVVAGAALAYAPDAVYVFELTSSGRLLRRMRLQARGGSALLDDSFGAAVAMSSRTIVVGAWGSPDTPGAAFIFKRSSDGWRQTQQLGASDGKPGDRFGTAVSINNDVIVVGAPGMDEMEDTGENQGAAYVFLPSNGSYVQRRRIQPDRKQVDYYQHFGTHIEMSLERIAISAETYFDLDRYPPPGHVFTFRISGTNVTAIGIAQQHADIASMSFYRNNLLLGTPFEFACWTRNRCIGEATLFDINRAQ